MNRTRIAALGLCLVLGASARADGGKLDRARDEIRGSGSRAKRSDRDGAGCGLICGLFSALLDTDDDDDDDGEARDRNGRPYTPGPVASARPEFGFARYPYERAHAHYLIPLDTALALYAPGTSASDVASVSLPLHTRRWAGQLALDAGHLDGITRSGFSARVMLPDGFELDARSAFMLEALPASDTTDQASIGGAHVSYRVLGAHSLLLRLGAGLRYWADGDLGALGPNLMLGIDVFPAQPFVVSAQLSGGSLGSALAVDARLQLGVALGRVELFAGFEWMQLDDVDLSMPLLGTRIWL